MMCCNLFGVVVIIHYLLNLDPWRGPIWLTKLWEAVCIWKALKNVRHDHSYFWHFFLHFPSYHSLFFIVSFAFCEEVNCLRFQKILRQLHNKVTLSHISLNYFPRFRAWKVVLIQTCLVRVAVKVKSSIACLDALRKWTWKLRVSWLLKAKWERMQGTSQTWTPTWQHRAYLFFGGFSARCTLLWVLRESQGLPPIYQPSSVPPAAAVAFKARQVKCSCIDVCMYVCMYVFACMSDALFVALLYLTQSADTSSREWPFLAFLCTAPNLSRYVQVFSSQIVVQARRSGWSLLHLLIG